jgi:predicted nicotinamide N-methyase
MVSILLDKMNVCESIIATDGDDDTMDLLHENIKLTGSTIQATKLYWGKDVDNFTEMFPSGFDVVIAADVIYEVFIYSETYTYI